MHGDEQRVVAAFCSWLEAEGWEVETEVAFVDVRATRNGQVLLAEAKGRTAALGLDVDTMYGQLLRRMRAVGEPGVRYAVVVPEAGLHAVLRVSREVRQALAIDVYTVSDEGTVTRIG